MRGKRQATRRGAKRKSEKDSKRKIAGRERRLEWSRRRE